jgi:signal transduction histidine kinase
LAEPGILLAVPDSTVYNNRTISNILLTAYHQRSPVVGFSPAYVKAGALLALYSTPAQVGQQAGEAARLGLATGSLPPPAAPRHFRISTNPYVARSLGIQPRGSGHPARAPRTQRGQPVIIPDEWDIRPRAVLIAALPTMVMALVLIAYFTSSRLSDLEDAHFQRGKALARQLAAASEYGVFSGNLESLRKQPTPCCRSGTWCAWPSSAPCRRCLPTAAGPPGRRHPTHPGTQPAAAVSRAGHRARHHPGRRLPRHGQRAPRPPGPPWRSAHRDEPRFPARRRSAPARNAFLMVTAVLIASVALALRMSRGISGPILRIASTVASFGQGNLSARVPVEGGRSLRALAEGVNDMADKLNASREDLERQIEAATHELMLKKEEAERGNHAKTRFLAAASHDLRQPMHALGLFVAELGQKQHAPDTHRLVERIAVSAETMENLLDSLLDISRLDAGVLDRQIKPFPLQPLFERIDVDYRREAELHGQRLRLRPTNLWVESDPLLLERILHNLISNALRYAPGGTVMLACRRRNGKARIEVRDNGPGISPDAQEAIFQEFVQLDNPERNRAKGLGLGLAIVRRLTDLLSHRLELRSTPGHGALFALELPLAPAGVRPEGTPTVAPPLPPRAARAAGGRR